MQELHDIKVLLDGYLKGKLTNAQRLVLDQWISQSPENRTLFNRIGDPKQLIKDLRLLYTSNENIFSRLAAQIPDLNPGIIDVPVAARVHRVHFLKTAWFRFAAAVILLLTGIALYYNFSDISQRNNKVAQTTPPSVAVDVLPGYNRAVLTLSNGQKVELDSAASETIKDGNLAIKNNSGQLIYSSERGSLSPAGGSPREAGEGGPSLNTMSTPRGGQYQLALSDGTKVWLNAASSITYPTTFTGNTREVSITGEAYFDVKPDKRKRFIVKTKEQRIEVLGTQFNVNTYEDEPYTKTSLINGAVKVNDKTLKPGQACAAEKITATNIEQDIAWRNGRFDFDNLTLQEAMRQLERWYDIRVVYEGKIPESHFVGELERSYTLQEILETLKLVHIKFELKGRTLTVRP